MKKILFLVLTTISCGVFSQAPQLINYQGVARNTGGTAITNAAIQLTVSVTGGSYVYTETHNTNSNAVGIFTIHIGGGSQQGSNTFAGINWGSSSQFISVTIDAGSGPQSLAPQQLVSVPYALYAQNAGSSSAASYVAGPGISISSGSIISNTAPQVTITSTPPITVSGSYPFFTIGSTATGTAGPAPQLFINAPNSVTSTTATNQHTITIATHTLLGAGITTVTNLSANMDLITTPPTTASYSAGILTLQPGGDTTFIPSGGPWIESGNSVTLVNNTNGNVGIGVASPSARLHIQSSAGSLNDLAINAVGSGDGINLLRLFGTGNAASFSLVPASSGAGLSIGNAGSGPGITINNGGNNAVVATSTGSASTIGGSNTGNGASIQGLKALVSGVSGDAIQGVNSNTVGAAVHAISGSAAGSALALWVDNGHIKSTSVAIPGVTTTTVSGGGISAVSYTVNPGSTDVKGSLNAVITTTTLINAGNFATLKVNFNKAYTAVPIVVVTPTSDMGQLIYFVSSTNQTSFTLMIKNGTPTNLSAPASLPLNFNYIVIE